VKGKLGIWFIKSLEKGVSSFKKDVIVFAFFLFLSFIFWYLNSLRKDIDIDIKYPVRYINTPKDRVIANELPPRLTFNLKGPGYSIIKLKISGNRYPVVIDFSNVTYKRMPNTDQLEYFIVSSGLIQSFKKQLNSDFQIVSIKPDTLFIVFEKKTGIHSSGKISTGSAVKSPWYNILQRILSSWIEFITERRQI
jgi:hypothetical protein